MSDESSSADVPDLMPEAPKGARRPWRVPLATGVAGLVVGAGAVGIAWGVDGGDGGSKPAAGSSASPSAATFNLTGTMELKQYSLDTGACAGKGGFDDIASGASVTVYDGGSQIVATGSLGTGVRSGLACDFSVWVPDVPLGPKFYQVEISHRGKLSLSADDAKAGKFSASLG